MLSLDPATAVPPESDRSALERSALLKVSLRLMPILFLLYVVNILDRANVSFAKDDMLADLKLDASVYAFAAGVFYLGYVLFEVPSNLILQRVGARTWIARIMVSWGAVSIGMMFVQGEWSFYLLRILLGVAEAGFFPGIILYMSYWFPARERARALALFMAASPVSAIIGNPLSGWILDNLHRAAGLAGWQWLFLIEGLPAVVLGVFVLVYLTDRPEQARWLSGAERNWLLDRLAAEKHSTTGHSRDFGKALSDPRVWLLIALYFTAAVGANGYGFYAIPVLKDRFRDESNLYIGLVAVLPNLAAVVGMLVNGVHSDRTGERPLHVAAAAFLSAGGWMLAAFAPSPWFVVAGLTIAQMGVMSILPVFWALPTTFLGGTAAAGGIALINSFGNIGGFVATNLFGGLGSVAEHFRASLLTMGGVMCVGGLLALCVRTRGRQTASPGR